MEKNALNKLHGGTLPVRRSVLSVNLDAVQAEFDGHRYAGTRSSLLITPSAHRAFHLAFEHIRRLSREDLQIINAAIRRNVKLTRTVPSMRSA